MVGLADVGRNGRGGKNPAFNASLSQDTQNYGAALKAISNLVRLDGKTYPEQATVLDKLVRNLQYLDDTASALKWATTPRGQTTAEASALQGALFSESKLQDATNPNSTGTQIERAMRDYKELQELHSSFTVSDYLTNNHIAIPNPVITIRNAVVSNPETWQTAPLNATLILDEGDLMDGGLQVKTPANAKVSVVLVGTDSSGKSLNVTLPTAQADSTGSALIKADESRIPALQQFDNSAPISAQVTVVDGNNSRTNRVLWSGKNTDVRIDLIPPAGMTSFAKNNPIELETDSLYNDGQP